VPEIKASDRPLTDGDLLELKRWNTPTIYNGWEQVTKQNSARDAFNLEETRDFMPQMGPMVGYAVTLVCQPGNAEHRATNPDAWTQYERYIASVPGPKIVVVQDLDKPDTYGSFWGEVSANIHRAFGCVGTITDGAVRDLDEMCSAGFKAIARRMCVGHAKTWPVRWGCEIEAFGRTVQPGHLVHADKHGFLVIPPEDQPRLLEAARFMDSNECQTMIPAARDCAGKTTAEILESLDEALDRFKANAAELQKRLNASG
jgi:4-hydroxy-4-methyl-2-oxoglutarate aldolase